MHNGFVRIDDEKMSKSLGNFFTVREVLKKVDATSDTAATNAASRRGANRRAKRRRAMLRASERPDAADHLRGLRDVPVYEHRYRGTGRALAAHRALV
jgi:hypothetical protein